MQNTKLYTIEDTWYSWIPTNLGQLNFSYIGDFSNLQKVFGTNNFQVQLINSTIKKIELKNTHLSDLNPINKFIQQIIEVENSAIIDIKDIKEDCNHYFQGTVTIKYNEDVMITGNFIVKINGKVSISDVKVTYNNDKVNSVNGTSTLDETIVTAIYTILKKVIHGDNHHEQKIDTLIGVYPGTFDPIQILDSFARNIKNRERVIKDSTKDNCYYKQQKMQASIEIDGYISYIDTFNELFQTDENKNFLEKKIKYLKNVSKSLKASAEKLKFNLELTQKHLTLLMTFFAFIVSLNIVHNGLYGTLEEHSNVHNRIDYIMWSIFIVIVMYLIFLRAVCYSSYLSKFNVFWEYMRYQAMKEKNTLIKLYTLIGTISLAFAFLLILKNILLWILEILLL